MMQKKYRIRAIVKQSHSDGLPEHARTLVCYLSEMRLKMGRTTVSYNAAISAMGATVKVWCVTWFYINLMPSAEPGASARWTLAIALLSEAGIFSTSFKVNKVPASNRGNAAVDGQFTLQANLLGGLKHVETLLNEEDDYCRYWFNLIHHINWFPLYSPWTAWVGSTPCCRFNCSDCIQAVWHTAAALALARSAFSSDGPWCSKSHCTMNTTSPFFSIHITFNRFQLPFPFQVVEVVFGHLNGHHHISPL